MNENMELFYFTGVGNSLRIANILNIELERAGWQVKLKDLAKEAYVDGKSACIGLVFPVYGFASPRIVMDFVQALPIVTTGGKAFIVVTMGGASGEGRSIVEVEAILREKGYKVNNTAAIMMPDSWLMSQKPSVEKRKLEEAEQQAVKFAGKIVSGVEEYRAVSAWIAWLSCLPTSGLFRSFGRNMMRRFFRTDEDKCTKCGMCIEVCPVSAIVKTTNERLRWTNKCEQCMRCVNFCPTNAIRQFYWFGFDKKYIEPHFKPMKQN